LSGILVDLVGFAARRGLVDIVLRHRVPLRRSMTTGPALDLVLAQSILLHVDSIFSGDLSLLKLFQLLESIAVRRGLQ